MYLTYEEYQARGGTLTEALYDRYEMRAEKLIDAQAMPVSRSSRRSADRAASSHRDTRI